MTEKPLTDAKRRLLDYLKRNDRVTTTALATETGLTEVAIRQQLRALEGLGLVSQELRPPERRGRPAVLWSLAEPARRAFPERHAELTIALIDATRRALGEDGLGRVIAARADHQVEQYRKYIPGSSSLRRRVEALARIRTDEGYMAEVRQERPGCYLLIEHHCPICDAARTCTGLCSAELDVFQRSLGDGASVERVTFLMEGDRRCTYRITSS